MVDHEATAPMPWLIAVWVFGLHRFSWQHWDSRWTDAPVDSEQHAANSVSSIEVWKSKCRSKLESWKAWNSWKNIKIMLAANDVCYVRNGELPSLPRNCRRQQYQCQITHADASCKVNQWTLFASLQIKFFFFSFSFEREPEKLLFIILLQLKNLLFLWIARTFAIMQDKESDGVATRTSHLWKKRHFYDVAQCTISEAKTVELNCVSRFDSKLPLYCNVQQNMEPHRNNSKCQNVQIILRHLGFRFRMRAPRTKIYIDCLKPIYDRWSSNNFSFFFFFHSLNRLIVWRFSQM